MVLFFSFVDQSTPDYVAVRVTHYSLQRQNFAVFWAAKFSGEETPNF